MNGSQNNISLYRSLTRGPDNHYRYRLWSTIIGRGPKLLCSHWSRPSLVMLAPAVLCHKEPALRIQSPLLGALERKIPPCGVGYNLFLLAASLWHKDSSWLPFTERSYY